MSPSLLLSSPRAENSTRLSTLLRLTSSRSNAPRSPRHSLRAIRLSRLVSRLANSPSCPRAMNSPWLSTPLRLASRPSKAWRSSSHSLRAMTPSLLRSRSEKRPSRSFLFAKARRAALARKDVAKPACTRKDLVSGQDAVAVPVFVGKRLVVPAPLVAGDPPVFVAVQPLEPHLLLLVLQVLTDGGKSRGTKRKENRENTKFLFHWS